jgi:hypothetical protein
MAVVSNYEEMSGRSGVSLASSMSGRGSDSGRGGRERQGAAQLAHALDLDSSESSSGEDDVVNANASNPPRTVQRSTYNASRRNAYSLWTEEKMTIVLQAIIDTPRRMLQNPSIETGFERNINRSGVSKTSIDKLEYTSDLFFIVIDAVTFVTHSMLQLWRVGQSSHECCNVFECKPIFSESEQEQIYQT